ncbi:M48 family metalloprotease [Niastella yeongjuensis]|nr:M48 family metalloprotease [Niastella yeongjuensis]
MITSWVIICISAVYWFTDIKLFFYQVRKPILEEERRLVSAMHEVQKKANDNKNYRLRVEENTGLNAYATGYHTIVVSKDCIKHLSHGELCALLAHEMGHLRTKDCTALLAYYFAKQPPGFVAGILRRGLKVAGGSIAGFARQSLLALLIAVIVTLFILSKSAILYYLLAVICFLLFLWLLNAVYSFLWLINSRYTEYRQDAFAHKLGFGPPLKQLLRKFLEENSIARVDQFYILTRSTHPLIHNRIRRLEKLEGLRK